MLAIMKFSLAGALLCLDRTAWGQLMLSRPLVAGTIIGWTGGNPQLGLLVGALLEMLWLHELPVGCAIPTHDTLVAVLASGVVTTIAGSRQLSDPYLTGSLVFLVLALLFCLAPASKKLETWIRSRNADLLVEMETRLLYGRPEEAVRIHLRGLANFWGGNFIAIFAAGSLMVLLVPRLHGLLPACMHRLLTHCLVIFPLLGTAAVLTGINKKYALVIFIILAFVFRTA